MSSLNKQLRKKVADLQRDLFIRGSFTSFKCFGFLHFGSDAIGSSWIQIVDLLVAWRPLALIMIIMEALSCLFETAAKIITAVEKDGIFFNPAISSLLSNRRVQSKATQSRAEKKVTCFFKKPPLSFGSTAELLLFDWNPLMSVSSDSTLKVLWNWVLAWDNVHAVKIWGSLC